MLRRSKQRIKKNRFACIFWGKNIFFTKDMLNVGMWNMSNFHMENFIVVFLSGLCCGFLSYFAYNCNWLHIDLLSGNVVHLGFMYLHNTEQIACCYYNVQRCLELKSNLDKRSVNGKSSRRKWIHSTDVKTNAHGWFNTKYQLRIFF